MVFEHANATSSMAQPSIVAIDNHGTMALITTAPITPRNIFRAPRLRPRQLNGVVNMEKR